MSRHHSTTASAPAVFSLFDAIPDPVVAACSASDEAFACMPAADPRPAPSTASRRAFKRALSELNRAYLAGRVDYVAFLHALFDLHRLHDRDGFDAIDLEHELDRHAQRRARGRRWASRRPVGRARTPIGGAIQ